MGKQRVVVLLNPLDDLFKRPDHFYAVHGETAAGAVFPP
jgi:hypothetical protein